MLVHSVKKSRALLAIAVQLPAHQPASGSLCWPVRAHDYLSGLQSSDQV